MFSNPADACLCLGHLACRLGASQVFTCSLNSPSCTPLTCEHHVFGFAGHLCFAIQLVLVCDILLAVWVLLKCSDAA